MHIKRGWEGHNLKLLDISSNCYAHLMNDTIYLYVNNEFTEILYINDIENVENPVPLIMYEIELLSRASLYENMEFIH